MTPIVSHLYVLHCVFSFTYPTKLKRLLPEHAHELLPEDASNQICAAIRSSGEVKAIQSVMGHPDANGMHDLNFSFDIFMYFSCCRCFWLKFSWWLSFVLLFYFWHYRMTLARIYVLNDICLLVLYHCLLLDDDLDMALNDWTVGSIGFNSLSGIMNWIKSLLKFALLHVFI